MAYPSISDVNTTKGIGQVLGYVNDITDSWLSNGFLITIYFIIVISVFIARKDWAEGFAIGGFITFLVGFLFYLADFVAGYTLVILGAVAVLGVISLFITKKSP